MTISRHHKNLKDLVAHYLSPLHFMGPIVCIACRSKRPGVRSLLFCIVRAYDTFFRLVVRY